MKIMIVHLSDIHIKDGNDAILSRVDKLAAAIQSADPSILSYFVVVTGDVASAGDREEYEVAYDFFIKLKDSIESQSHAPVVNWILVPGNHDCNFQKDTSARQVLIKTIHSYTDKLTKDYSIIKTCLTVQQDFFEFLSKLTDTDPLLDGPERLHYVADFNVLGKQIRFNCYNTAWLSQLNEKQGELSFPVDTIQSNQSKYDLVLSLFHHPYNWLEANNSRAFRKHIERTSDIILTGHEHDSSYYEKLFTEDERPHYIEGSLLQNSGDSESGFILLAIDLDQQLHKVIEYSWSKNMFVPMIEPDWQRLERGRALKLEEFENNQKFASFLADPGAEFSHPEVAHLQLADIFVYPDIDVVNFEKSILAGEHIYSEGLLKYVLDNSHLIFNGTDVSGKTSLAKTLYKDLQQRRIVPVFVRGEDFKDCSEDGVLKVVHRAFKEQYNGLLLEKYKQLDPKMKALMIDDFHRSELNIKGLNKILKIAEQSFSRVIIFADDTLLLREVMAPNELPSFLLHFHHCAISDFGHRLRGRLIEKWLSLGQEYSGSQQAIAYRVSSAEHLVNTLVGKGVLPSQPLFILIILQSLDSQTTLHSASGALGQYYEILITRVLANVYPSLSLDTKYAYLSFIAYAMFDRRQKAFGEDEIVGLSNEYYHQYKMRINPEVMMADLENLVFQKTDGGFSFRYRYMYCYFVAHYFSENFRDPAQENKLKEQLQLISEKVYSQDYATILIFFLYLTKDSDIIQRLLSQARSIYREYEPCDFDSDTEFVNRLHGKAPKLSLESDDIKVNREKYREYLDEIESDENKYVNEEDVADILRVNVAYKMIQILGQILRNFPGSLKGEVKQEVAREAYLLSLRTLRMTLSKFEKHLPTVRLNVAALFLGGFVTNDEPELSKRIDRALFVFIWQIAYTSICSVSYAVGSEQLKETYKQIVLEDKSVSMSLIDMAIKLDHFRSLPENEIYKLYKEIKGNIFSSSILRGLVLDYLYLYPCSYQTRQKLCSKLDIAINYSKILDIKSKMIN